MKIGILQTGYPPDSARPVFGNYADAFTRLLKGHGFDFSSWACLDGEFPPSISSADGWLITGSKFGAYENLPWIHQLEDFLRSAYVGNVPIVGICFGHQILAQALGGKVEKFSGGWSIGRVNYHLDGIAEPVPLYAWHQDQVVELPEDATPVGSTPFCKYAALSYSNNRSYSNNKGNGNRGYAKKAFTVQPHPEFSSDYIKHLLDARRESLPGDVTRQADLSLLEGDTDSAAMATTIATFFKSSVHQSTG